MMPHLKKVATEMGAFGSSAIKLCCLKGTAPWITHLACKCSRKDRRRIIAYRGKHIYNRSYIIAHDRSCHRMSSAAYPTGFGKLVGIQFSKFCKSHGLQSWFGTDGRPVVVKDFDGVPGIKLPPGTFDDVWQQLVLRCGQLDMSKKDRCMIGSSESADSTDM